MTTDQKIKVWLRHLQVTDPKIKVWLSHLQGTDPNINQRGYLLHLHETDPKIKVWLSHLQAWLYGVCRLRLARCTHAGGADSHLTAIFSGRNPLGWRGTVITLLESGSCTHHRSQTATVVLLLLLHLFVLRVGTSSCLLAFRMRGGE